MKFLDFLVHQRQAAFDHIGKVRDLITEHMPYVPELFNGGDGHVNVRYVFMICFKYYLV